jgi:hypothetical protein
MDNIDKLYQFGGIKNNNLIQIGSGKKNNILFLFFNGGGLTKKQWYEHPYKDDPSWLDRPNENSKTNLISKIKKLGDVYLYTPVFYFKKEDIINNKTFTIKDLDLINHCKELYKKIKNYKKIFIISHSRGWILSKFFISLYHNKIVGYINIDGGEGNIYKEHLEKWKKDFEHIDDNELIKLFKKIKKNDNDSVSIVSKFVKYIIYKQYFEYKYNYDNIKMIILNNIYNDKETSIKDTEYVNTTLMSKFDYNKQFENNINIKSIYYVGKSHFLYFYDSVVNDIIDNIKTIIHK